jgi:hypothetical protein
MVASTRSLLVVYVVLVAEDVRERICDGMMGRIIELLLAIGWL